jgi:transcriptional regulator GlxA family with amidase domain
MPSRKSCSAITIQALSTLLLLLLLLLTVTMAACTPRNISIGVLYLRNYQYLDAAGPIDLITMSSTSYASKFAPDAVKALTPVITWHYISASYPSTMQASGGPASLPTTGLENCPKLDYLLMPGPPPDVKLTEAEKNFIEQRAEEVEAVMAVCTAGYILSQTSLLQGKTVCTNKSVLRRLAERGEVPKGIKWCRDRRWVVDGKIWSSAGITAGMDLGVQFVRRVVGEVVWQWVSEVAEYSPIEMGADRFGYMLTDAKLD